MKRLVFLLIVILTSLTLVGQDKKIVSYVTIPDSIAAKVIDELIVNDHLTFTVAKQDSIITIYHIDLENKKTEIRILKTNEEEYKKIVVRLNEIIALRDAQIIDLKKKNRISWFKMMRNTVIEGVIIIGLVVLLVAK